MGDNSLNPVESLIGFVQNESDALLDIYSKELIKANEIGMLIVEYEQHMGHDGKPGFNVYYCPKSKLIAKLQSDLESRIRKNGEHFIYFYLDTMIGENTNDQYTRGFVVELDLRQF